MVFMEEGRVSDFKFLHCPKQAFGMSSTPSGILILLRNMQLQKAPSPRFVILLGSVMLVNSLLLERPYCLCL